MRLPCITTCYKFVMYNVCLYKCFKLDCNIKISISLVLISAVCKWRRCGSRGTRGYLSNFLQTIGNDIMFCTNCIQGKDISLAKKLQSKIYELQNKLMEPIVLST